MSKPLSELSSETVERWKKFMSPLADRPNLQQIDERFREAQRIREEAVVTVEEAKKKAEDLQRQYAIKRLYPQLSMELYECPKCQRKCEQSELNYLIKGRGKHKKKLAWCPYCNLQMFPEGDEALKHPVIPLKDKMLKVTFNNK